MIWFSSGCAATNRTNRRIPSANPAASAVCALRLDVHAAPPLDVLQQLARELLLAKEPRGLKCGRRACQRIGIRSQEQFDDRGVVLEDGAFQRGLPSGVVPIVVAAWCNQCGD